MKLRELTEMERSILHHRLGVPDALAEVLDEYAPEDVEAVTSALIRDDMDGAMRISEAITKDVLQDAVEGSTTLGAASQESKQKQAAIFRAGESLARKVSEFIGRKVEYPTY